MFGIYISINYVPHIGYASRKTKPAVPQAAVAYVIGTHAQFVCTAGHIFYTDAYCISAVDVPIHTRKYIGLQASVFFHRVLIEIRSKRTFCYTSLKMVYVTMYIVIYIKTAKEGKLLSFIIQRQPGNLCSIKTLLISKISTSAKTR